MRSFSCWRATRVRARPLSPLVGAPALHTLHPLPNLHLTTPSSSRAERLFPPQPLPLWGRTAPPLHFECGAGWRDPSGCHPLSAALGAMTLAAAPLWCLGSVLGFYSHFCY